MLRVKIKFLYLFFIIFFLCEALYVYAQENKFKGMPAAKVVVAEVSSGIIETMTEFIGTVYYSEVSNVATEVSGKVMAVEFQEGQIKKSGSILARLGSDLLEKTLEAKRLTYEQTLTDIEKAKIDLKRVENLHRQESIAEQIFNDHIFKVKALEKKALSLRAEVEHYKIELDKKTITAPFTGIIVKRHVDRGEWLKQGETVATLARNDVLDVLVDVPERIIKFIKSNMIVELKVSDKIIEGKVLTIIPKGDISTSTFPVR